MGPQAASALELGMTLTLGMLALATLALSPRRELSWRWLAATRVLFPAWRFFDRPGDESSLWVRFGHDPSNLADWQSVHPPLSPRWHHILVHPGMCLLLRERDQIESLALRLPELGPAIVDDPSYRAAAIFARRHVQAQVGPGAWYQFEVRSTPAVDNPELACAECMLRSPLRSDWNATSP